MATMLIKHTVKDYSTWRRVYDEHKTFRIKSGMLTEKVYRNNNNPSEIFMIFNWNNIMNAKIFVQSENLKKTMQNAGVTSTPEIHFLEEMEQITSTKPIIQPILR